MKKKESKPRNKRNLKKHLKMIKNNSELLRKYSEELKK
jgi:hypothetical protein